jgi:SAM-dependent methyltransferase
MSVRDFYDDLAADYDAIFADWKAGVHWQAQVIARLLPEDPILDISAGMGTQAIGLALIGHKVLARDLSPALVERGRQEAARMGATLLGFEVGDMRQSHAEDAGRFGSAIAFDNSLPHLLEDADLTAALSATFAALRPGGRFLASIRDYDRLALERPCMDPPRLLGVPPSRRLVQQVWTWAPDGKSYELDHLILREGVDGWSLRTRRTRYRSLARVELVAAARACGFVDLTWLEPSESEYYQPIFVARKPRPPQG